MIGAATLSGAATVTGAATVIGAAPLERRAADLASLSRAVWGVVIVESQGYASPRSSRSIASANATETSVART